MDLSLQKPLVLDESQQQKVNYPSYGFQHWAFEAKMPLPISVIWHWHDSIEFVHVLSGTCVFHLSNQDVIIPPDGLLLVNSGAFHSAGTADTNTPVSYRTQIIELNQLSGIASGSIRAQYFDPIVSCQELQCYLFLPGTPEHAKVKTLFEEAYACTISKSFMHELTTSQNLTQIWMLFIEATQHVWRNNPLPQNNVQGERVKEMLLFIQENFAEKLTLEQIADSARISTRECSRCFQNTLNTTPIEYLTEYRLRKATDLLLNTSTSIIDIALQCGFSSSSYFCHTFKRIMGQSPSEYKRTCISSNKQTNPVS